MAYSLKKQEAESCGRCCYIAVHLVHSCWKSHTVSMFRAEQFEKFLHCVTLKLKVV